MPNAPKLTLWGVGTSRTIRAHWAMAELGLAYETRPIGARTGKTQTAEYTRLNPRQKIPLLQDDDFCIGESAAIVAYLSRTYSQGPTSLIPEAPRDYAAWLEWCFFIVTELDSTSLYVMRRHSANALGPIYGIAPDVVAKAGEYFREQLRYVEAAFKDALAPNPATNWANRIVHGYSAASTTGAIRREWRSLTSQVPAMLRLPGLRRLGGRISRTATGNTFPNTFTTWRGG